MSNSQDGTGQTVVSKPDSSALPLVARIFDRSRFLGTIGAKQGSSRTVQLKFSGDRQRLGITRSDLEPDFQQLLTELYRPHDKQTETEILKGSGAGLRGLALKCAAPAQLVIRCGCEIAGALQVISISPYSVRLQLLSVRQHQLVFQAVRFDSCTREPGRCCARGRRCSVAVLCQAEKLNQIAGDPYSSADAVRCVAVELLKIAQTWDEPTGNGDRDVM